MTIDLNSNFFDAARYWVVAVYPPSHSDINLNACVPRHYDLVDLDIYMSFDDTDDSIMLRCKDLSAFKLKLVARCLDVNDVMFSLSSEDLKEISSVFN